MDLGVLDCQLDLVAVLDLNAGVDDRDHVVIAHREIQVHFGAEHFADGYVGNDDGIGELIEGLFGLVDVLGSRSILR